MEERDSMIHRNPSAAWLAAALALAWEKAEMAEEIRIRLEKGIGKAAGRPAPGRIPGLSPGRILRECPADPILEDAAGGTPVHRRDVSQASRAAEEEEPDNGRPSF